MCAVYIALFTVHDMLIITAPRALSLFCSYPSAVPALKGRMCVTLRVQQAWDGRDGLLVRRAVNGWVIVAESRRSLLTIFIVVVVER